MSIWVALCLALFSAGCALPGAGGPDVGEEGTLPQFTLRANTPALTPPAQERDATGAGGGRKLAAYRLKALDPIVINLRSIPEPVQMEEIIDEDGYVNLPYIGRIKAAGLTGFELEQAVQDTYTEQGYYRHVTVNVLVASQSYYVRGEVKKPGRFPLISGVRLLQAVATAGGFTEYANPKKIKLIRGVKTFEYNYWELEESPEKDVDVEAGDVIVVPRSWV
jgi:polysaccharide export outer membrane protein